MTEAEMIMESSIVHDQPPGPAAADDASFRSVRGFASLVVTQFLGAVNDNILKGVLIYMVIDGSWTGRLGEGGQGIVSLCLTLSASVCHCLPLSVPDSLCQSLTDCHKLSWLVC